MDRRESSHSWYASTGKLATKLLLVARFPQLFNMIHLPICAHQVQYFQFKMLKKSADNQAMPGPPGQLKCSPLSCSHCGLRFSIHTLEFVAPPLYRSAFNGMINCVHVDNFKIWWWTLLHGTCWRMVDLYLDFYFNKELLSAQCAS